MTEALQTVIAEVKAKLSEIDQKLNDVDAAAPVVSRFAVDSSPLSLFWDDATKADVTAQLTSAFTDATTYTRDAIAPFTRFGVGPGEPWTLRSHADEWLQTFAAHAGALADEISNQSLQLPAMDETSWDSAAREAYRDAKEVQQRMVDALSGLSATFETALREMAGSLEAFWWAMLSCVISILVAILGLVAGGATAITIIGIPIGVAIAILGVVGAVVSVIVPFVMGFTIQGDQRRHLAEATNGLTWATTPFGAV
jgi:hypothetical protein